jgi:hypothetical protein
VLAPGLLSSLSESSTEANAIAGRATFLERAVFPEMVTIQEKVTNSILPAYGDNLVGEFEDPRYVDRQLKLTEMAEYSKTHTVEEIRRKYYSDEMLGDERDNLFIAQITADTGKPAPEPAPVVIAQEEEPEDTVIETVPPVEQNALKPEEIKALVEIDRWDAKSEKAGKRTVWHNVGIPDVLFKALKAGEITFDEAREKIRVSVVSVTPIPEHVIDEPTAPDYSPLLEAIRLEVQAIKSVPAPAEPQPINVTVHNHPGEPPIVNVAGAEPVIVNVPDQPPAQVTVKTEAPKEDSTKSEAVEELRKLTKRTKRK